MHSKYNCAYSSSIAQRKNNFSYEPILYFVTKTLLQIHTFLPGEDGTNQSILKREYVL